MSISIALTKGRLEKETVKLLDKADYGTEELKDKGRKLVFNDTKKDIKYFLVKAADSITYVEHGVADIGVVGKDTLLEGDNNYYEVLDLGIGKCRFIVASLPEKNIFKKVGHIKIGTKYPTVAKNYFKEKGMDVEIIKIEGSVELAPILGLCDAIVDIMETGTTLKENGLVVFDTICEISARVIVNKASCKMKKDEVWDFIENLRRVIGLSDGNLGDEIKEEIKEEEALMKDIEEQNVEAESNQAQEDVASQENEEEEVEEVTLFEDEVKKEKRTNPLLQVEEVLKQLQEIRNENKEVK
ncbi:ATP phosphoribosyltransferase [Clostridium sp. MSJ-8]|nr:ATP phosphoribosyltransferase [Clostridium sp. MSJ-8]